MWSSLTLRSRVVTLLGALLVALFVATLVGLWFATTEDFNAEREPFERQSAQVASSMNAIVNATREPEKIVEALRGSLEGSNGTIRLSQEPPTEYVNVPNLLVPAWFMRLLPVAEHQPRSYSLKINDRTIGYLTFVQDMFPDILEKWITFVGVIILFSLFAVGSLFVVHFGVGTMFRPLEAIASGLSAIERNDVPDVRSETGPPEINRLARKVNEIGQTLHSLRRENEQLLRSVVTAQDRERDAISRDLHDELGPLLFALRAGAVSLQGINSVEHCRDRATDMERLVETLQSVHRQLLDRLRPMDLIEIGLRRSILDLIDRAMAIDENLTIEASIDTKVDTLEEPIARTILRVVQESVLNVQRHSGARRAFVELKLVKAELHKSDVVRVVVSDDGKGTPMNFKVGRGLSGIKERARALGGQFEIAPRDGGGTIIVCTLPAQMTA